MSDRPPPPKHFPATGRLVPADAAAVILWTADGRYLVQVRDDIAGIFYPGHDGLFGGAREGEETMLTCAERELREEIGLDFAGRLKPFLSLTLDFAPFGHGRVLRDMFEAEIAPDEVSRIRLGEGRRAELVAGETLLRARRITPYDAFALWQHYVVRFQP